MSFAGLCAWTFARSLLIAILSLVLIVPLSRFLVNARGPSLRWAWLMLFVPFLSPDLLIGYPYANSAWSLVHYPIANEFFYALLLLFKFTPVGSLILMYAPQSALSAEAYHCRKLLLGNQSPGIGQRLVLLYYYFRGPGKPGLFASSLIFLLCFQEFELVSLLQFGSGGQVWPASWTVRIFDAQTGGFSIAESLRLMLQPVSYQLVGLVLPFLLISAPSSNGRNISQLPASCSPLLRFAGWVYLLIASLVCFVLPGLYLFQQSAAELSVLQNNNFFAREILTSTVFALISATLVVSFTRWIRFLSHSGPQSRLFSQKCVQHAFLILAAVPGLLGSLVLSLVVLWIFQSLAYTSLIQQIFPYGITRLLSALPLVVTLSFWLLPRAFILQAMKNNATYSAPLHLAQLLDASWHPAGHTRYQDLKWILKTGPQFWFFALVAWWAYWDLIASSILIPPGLISAPIQINALVHYGQWGVLSALLAATLCFPIVLIAVVLLFHQVVLRRFFR